METLATDTGLCEEEFDTWAERRAALLWQGRFEAVDREEIADPGRPRSARLEAACRPIRLHRPERMPQPRRGRDGTIGRERPRAARLLRRDPGLKPRREALLLEARAEAAPETDLPPTRCPATLPSTLGQVVDPDFRAEPAR